MQSAIARLKDSKKGVRSIYTATLRHNLGVYDHTYTHLRTPRPVALPGVGPDAELVLCVVVQVGEHSLALGRGAHALLLGLNSLELKIIGVENKLGI